MYGRILLAVALQRWDRYSAHALAARSVAATLVQSAAQRLHVLSVYGYKPTPAAGLSAEMSTRFRDEEKRRTDAVMARRLDEYVGPLAQGGLAVTKLLRVGEPRELIVAVAREIGADLLIIGSHSKRGVLDIALGGTAQHVTRTAPCPVVLVSPGARSTGPA